MHLEQTVAILSEIAYLLRQREEQAYRARAFSAATGALVRGRPDLMGLRAEGRLETVEGVGPGIARVLAEIVDTGSSSYLERLRAEAGLDQGQPSRLTLDGYRGDLHAHTVWSDGRATVLEMALGARRLGYEYLAITDHSPRMTIVRGLDAARLAQQATEIISVQAQVEGLTILRGIEVDILEDGSLDLPDEVLASLDIVVASPHLKLRMERGAMTERMLRAVESPHVDIIGHPTGRRPGARPPADYDLELVFKRAAASGTALEIDCDPARMDLSPELARLAAGCGCCLALDSDAHAPEEYAYVEMGVWMARRAGLEPDQILNWRPAAHHRAGSGLG